MSKRRKVVREMCDNMELELRAELQRDHPIEFGTAVDEPKDKSESKKKSSRSKSATHKKSKRAGKKERSKTHEERKSKSHSKKKSSDSSSKKSKSSTKRSKSTKKRSESSESSKAKEDELFFGTWPGHGLKVACADEQYAAGVAKVEAVREVVENRLFPKKQSFAARLRGDLYFKVEYILVADTGNDALRRDVCRRLYERDDGFEPLRAEHIKGHFGGALPYELLECGPLYFSFGTSLLRIVHRARFWLGSKSSPFAGVGALAASQIILLAHQDELRHFAPEQQERLAMAIAERAVDNSTINKDICGDCIDQVLVSFDLISFPVAH